MDPDSVPKTYLDCVDKLLSKPVNATELIGAVCQLPGGKHTTSSAIQS
jgi:hypothetical protein